MKRDQNLLKNKKSVYLSDKKTDKKTDKKSWVLFFIQMLFLIFSLLLVLWGQKKLRSLSRKKAPSAERKADFIAPAGDFEGFKRE